MNDAVVTTEPLTLRVGGIRALKVSDGFVTFDFFGTEMNVRASAVDSYRLLEHVTSSGKSAPAIELTVTTREFVIEDPCVEDWIEFKNVVQPNGYLMKGTLA